jgi:isocitrate/isopropylmalate dehydrogenase
MSDLVLQMFGSIAGSESLLISFNEDWLPRVVMAEAPHGTAPALFGKNLANPMAMILAAGSLLSYFGEPKATLAARAISEAVFEAVYDGVRTADLQGHAMTTEFTDEVIKRVKTKLAVWPTLNA